MVMQVQHHIAHVLSCMAENEIAPPALGVSWDGTGYGTDGTTWGGEFFLVTDENVERIAHLRPFRLPGGDKAVKEPSRAALGLLHEISSDKVFEQKKLAAVAAFSSAELATLKTMLAKKLNSPLTSSAGRLFDAVASLINLRQQIRFEGQAAMELEFAIDGVKTGEAYPLPIEKPAGTTDKSAIGNRQSTMILDWSPMVEAILVDVQHGVSVGIISAKFHNALAEGIVAVAKRAGQNRVVLSGGCFQNRYLTERAVRRLQAEGFRPYWHQRVPPNDGGIALGQVVAALRRKE
jgi:hydrogenase maturation protein HypF